jgi:protein phosphatase
LNNDENDYLMAIADGMGGHSAGEVASSIAINYLHNHFKESFHEMSKIDAVNWIRDAVNEINTLIFQYEKEHPESKGMGTTLVMAILTKDFLLFGNVGDSSGFVMKDNNLHKVTYDHTLVNLLVSAGELTKEEASVHPKKNVLMKALGASPEVDVDIFDCDMDITEILLSSDGLTGMLDREGIERVLTGEGTVEEKVLKLVRKANNRGGTDNISVAYLVRSEEGEDE